ncbi:MAG: response regulator transcription factor [Ruminococcus sp.]|nr:response regulator transcription factor [Ruminococcus sp.]
MFKVLLVDDEPNVRQGIKMMIPWDEIGCEVVDEADDGDEGLNKIMTVDPDIVIADIKMPGKTGIEMTESAKAMGFKGKVLILSGYSDFSYAKTAIALGVENFILKPVDEDELIEAIKTAGEKINRERDRRYKQEIGREYLNEQLVKGLFAGDSEIVETMTRKYEFSAYCAVVICCDPGLSREEQGVLYGKVRERLGGISNADTVTVDMSGITAVLFKGKGKSEIKETLERIAEECRGVFIACGEYVPTPDRIKDSYAFAESVYRSIFIYRHLGLVTPDIISKSPAETADIAANICAYMEINDKEKISAAMGDFMRSQMYSGNTPERAKISCITMLMDIRSKLIRSAADKKPENLITDEFIANLENSGSLYEMTKAAEELLGNVSDGCFGKSTKSNMERVVQYIRANYSRELRLEQLAGIFGYNSAYLGKVFHRYTGENFNNYLDRIRITEAKRLLECEEYKVYEVAETVGYTNINYFHNKFKKYVGMSPLSYKKMHSNREESQGDNE